MSGFLVSGLSLAGLLLASGSSLAGELADRVGVTRGLCVVVGNSDAQAAVDLARETDLLVYLQVNSPAAASNARQAAEAAGLGPRRLVIGEGDPDRIGIADNLADVVIGAGVSNAEAMRVLRPGGRAWLHDRELVKPAPAGIDDWTHPYHGPDNNPVSRDTLIRAPYLTQFLSDPRYGPAPQVAVAAGGRIFKAFGHVAWHEREEPFLNTLVGFDGYNGTLLWQRPLPEGMMVHRNTIIATPELLYLGDHQSCKVIDAATGETKSEIIPPVDVAGGTFWKWMALEDGVLYALTGEDEHRDETTRWRRQEHGWPWTGVSKGYNVADNPWGMGCNLLAIDPETKAVLWHYHEEQPIDSRAVCMKNGRLFAFRFGAYLTCLDAKTGQILWRKTNENAPELFATLGSYLPRQGWQTNWRTTAYLKCSEHALYFAGPQLEGLLAVSTEDGRVLWQNDYDNFQLVLLRDGLYGISGPWGNNLSRRFDPLTGEILARLPTGRRACTRPTATSDSILFRAMGGTVRFDLASEQPRWISPMRPSCHDGVTIANGLLYWWPYVCDCQLSLNGLTSVGPAGDFDFSPDVRAADRLQPGDLSAPMAPWPPSAADWPTFRADNNRTASTRATVPAAARLLWQTTSPAADGTRPTAPVAAGGLVLVAGDDGAVRAWDGTTGEARWTVRTGGEIRIPPTVADGRALFGSGDGWVYAVEAATGRLLWRFRAAPAERRIPVYGSLLSTWPAASGVLVQDGTAYVAAGLVNYDGTYVYALDAATGQVKWCNDRSGHLDAQAKTGVSVQGHLLLHGDTLYLAGGNAVSPAAYDSRDGSCLNDAGALAQCESTSPRGWELFMVGDRVIACGSPFYQDPDLPVYDHTVTSKLLHVPGESRDVVWIDNQVLAGFDPLDKEELNRCVSDERIPRHVTQKWGQFRVSQSPRWRYDCPGSVAVAVAANGVVVADGDSVKALALDNGQPLWSHKLPASPVPWGLAIDSQGRVVLTLVDGQVWCFGE